MYLGAVPAKEPLLQGSSISSGLPSVPQGDVGTCAESIATRFRQSATCFGGRHLGGNAGPCAETKSFAPSSQVSRMSTNCSEEWQQTGGAPQRL